VNLERISPTTHGSGKDDIYRLWVNDFLKLTGRHHIYELVACALLLLAVVILFIPGFEKIAAVPFAFSLIFFYSALATAAHASNTNFFLHQWELEETLNKPSKSNTVA
jgi:hypothetical protein